MRLLTERVVLIRYTVDEQSFVGSGLRVRDRFVLTADHCAQGTDHQVEFLDGSRFAATVHVRSASTEVDLAALLLEGAAAVVEGLGPARVDHDVAETLTGAQALGFPRWKRGDADGRILAQVDGFVPTAEGLRPGAGFELLELKGTGPSVREYPTSPGVLNQASPWGGMSGAAVVVDSAVLGVVRSHNLAAGGMSLTFTPLAAIAALPEPVAERFIAALALPADVQDWPVLPDRVASLSRTVLSVLDAAGHPPRVGDVDAGGFGARKARTDLDLHGDAYYPYVAREVDEQLAAALDRRLDGSDARMLLLVGEAMAGKSRTGAHALQTHPVLRDLPLLVPAAGSGLDRVADLTEQLIARTAAAGAVLWLDDLNEYYAWLTESLAVRWRASPGLIVVGTVRRDQLATLQGAAELRATWEFVSDENQVEQVKLMSDWSQAEQEGLTEAPDWIQTAVAAGTPLGELLGAARELLLKLENADPPTRGLVELIVDWQRTGIQEPLPHTTAISLWSRYLPRRDAGALAALSSKEIERSMTKARRQACEPIPGTYAALLTTTDTASRAEDLLINARTTHGDPILVEVWEAALDHALWNLNNAPDIVLLLGYNAATTAQPQVARRAWQCLAEADNTDAQTNLGILLTRLDPPELDEARRWYTTAAATGHTGAQNNLGLLLPRLDPPELDEARRWLTAAAEAGHTGAQANLATLLAIQLDPPELDEARRWLTAAAEAGHTGAQNNLGILLASRLDPPELDEARRWWTAAAEAGHTDAQTNLGHLLATRLDPPELNEARRWWTAAAEAGHADAQTNLGHLLATRLDPPELDEACRWLTAAAEAGHTDAQTNLGLLAIQLDPSELNEARRWWTAAAEAGHTGAQTNLGLLLTQLDPPELDEARRWYTTAAEAGHTDAQTNLGLLLTRLDPPELDEARRWYTTAAEARDTDAQTNLGLLLTQLDPPELDEARRWYTTAAEAGNTDAQTNLGILLTQLDPPELNEARRWLTTAAEAGHTDAQTNLGLLLATRLDPPELDEARRWWTTAAEAGHTGAQSNLGNLLATRLDPPELNEARRWWTTAAEAGHADAQSNLGNLLATRLDPPELNEARRWLTTAAEAGDTDAQYNLGLLLATRLDPPELDEARRWWTAAAEAGNTDAQTNLGVLAIQLDPPELDEARRWWTAAAEAGNTDAQTNLGVLAIQLDPPELNEARRWWTAAAEAGNTDAQTNLGILLSDQPDPPELGEARRSR